MSDWRWSFAKLVAAIVAVELIMVGLGMGPEVLLIAALGGFLGVFGWFWRSLDALAWPGPPSPPAIAPPAKQDDDPRVRSLRSGIVAIGRRDFYSQRVRRTLVELIDDQLAFAHGIDREHHPEFAADLLGPELTAFVNRPATEETMLDPDMVERIVTRIEQL